MLRRMLRRIDHRAEIPAATVKEEAVRACTW
jgi:hypothetical protein